MSGRELTKSGKYNARNDRKLTPFRAVRALCGRNLQNKRDRCDIYKRHTFANARVLKRVLHEFQ